MALALWVWLAGTQILWADGFRNPFQDSAAVAQGNAFRAQADNPSAVFYNPAGMTQLSGVQHSFGIQFLNVHTEFHGFSGNHVENDMGGLVGLPPPGQFFLTGNLSSIDLPILKNVTLGLGVQSLFGFSTKYPKDGPFSSVITKAQLPLLNIKPTIAYKLHERLSLGFGLDIFTFASFMGEGRSVQHSVAAGNIPGTTPGQELELYGTGTALGINASLLWTPWLTAHGKPRVNVAFVWRSQAKLNLSGAIRADGQKLAGTKTAFHFPDSYEWGVAIWPVRTDQYEWKVEVDVDYVRWSTIKNFDVSFSDGTVLPNPQSWNDAITIGAGTEWKWMKPTSHPHWDFAVRGGYVRSHNSIPDQNFNPAFHDSDVNMITAGLGGLCRKEGKFLWLISCDNFLSKAIGVDIAYFAFLWEPRTVTNHPNPNVNGKFESIIHAGSITFRMQF